MTSDAIKEGDTLLARFPQTRFLLEKVSKVLFSYFYSMIRKSPLAQAFLYLPVQLKL